MAAELTRLVEPRCLVELDAEAGNLVRCFPATQVYPLGFYQVLGDARYSGGVEPPRQVDTNGYVGTQA